MVRLAVDDVRTIGACSGRGNASLGLWAGNFAGLGRIDTVPAAVVVVDAVVDAGLLVDNESEGGGKGDAEGIEAGYGTGEGGRWTSSEFFRASWVAPRGFFGAGAGAHSGRDAAPASTVSRPRGSSQRP
jgi:hypothetical protein